MGRRLPAAYWASKSLDSMIGTRSRAQAAISSCKKINDENLTPPFPAKINLYSSEKRKILNLQEQKGLNLLIIIYREGRVNFINVNP